MKTYEWQRLWRDVNNNSLHVDSDGYLPDPNTLIGRLNPHFQSFADLSGIPCLVLLGSPGMGKSYALLQAFETAQKAGDGEAHHIDLRQYGDEGRLAEYLDRTLGNAIGTQGKFQLFLDSFDECALRVDTLRTLLLGKLKQLPGGRIWLRIASRPGAWPAMLQQELPALWDGAPSSGDGPTAMTVELAPLRKSDVELAARQEDVNPERFVEEVARTNTTALASCPITLKFLLEVYKRTKALPTTRHALYRAGCLELCVDRDQWTTPNVRGQLSAAKRLAVASRVAALSVLCGRSLISLEDLARPSEDLLTLTTLVGGFENAENEDFAVNEAAIRETIERSGLFSAAGESGQLGWAHQTYAEYLAAMYLIARAVPLRKLRTLLMHHEDHTQVIPQLAELTAWMAACHAELCEELVTHDPQALLNSELEQTPENVRAKMTQGLLAGFADGTLMERFSERAAGYAKLQHSGIAAQLRPVLDAHGTATARSLAIDIAKDCRLREVQGSLIRIALDEAEEPDLRSDAARAIAEIGDSQTVGRLKQVLSGTGDPEDTLRGIALSALVPSHISRADVFELLPDSKPKSNVLGSYGMFVYRFSESLKLEDLPAALRWLAGQPARKHQRFAHALLCESILRLGAKHSVDPEIAALMVPPVLACIQHHENILEPPRSEDGNERSIDWQPEARINIVHAIAHSGLLPLKEAGTLKYCRPALLRDEDMHCLVERLGIEQDGRTRSQLIGFIATLFARADSKTWEVALDAADTASDLAEALKPYASSVELGSNTAQGQRRLHEELHRTSEGEPEVQWNHVVDGCLHRVASGDSVGWTDLMSRMFAERVRTGAEAVGRVDVAQSAIWRDLDATRRTALLAAAKSYLVAVDPDNANWFESRMPSTEAWVGYEALRLVLANDPSWLRLRDVSFWTSWVPIAVEEAEPSNEETCSLSRIAYGVAPNVFLEAVLKLVDSEGTKTSPPRAHLKLECCWDARTAAVLLTRTAGAVSPLMIALLAQGIRHGAAGFSERALTLLQDLHTATRVESAADVGAMLMTESPEESWSVLWPMITENEDFAARVAGQFYVKGHRRLDALTQRLAVPRLGALYHWLERKPANNPNLPYQDTLDTFRQDLGSYLQSCGAPESIGIFDQLARASPKSKRFDIARHVARRTVLRKTWKRPTPDQVLQLTTRAEKELVRGADDLLDVVMDTLDRVQAALVAETPLVRLLWWPIKKGITAPRSENDLSDVIASLLRRELKERGVILHREVEIRQWGTSGERVDIHVDAVTRTPSGGTDVCKVIIETKGCWNPELDTAMQHQLVARYLRQNDCRHGIYLVGWFASPAWSKMDGRNRTLPPKEELRAQLEAQAKALSTDGTHIRAFVLDVSLRSAPARARRAKKAATKKAATKKAATKKAATKKAATKKA